MTPRNGLYLALVGFLVIVAIQVLGLVLDLFRDSIPPEVNDNLISYVIVIGGGLLLTLLGLIAMVVGLVFALKKQSVKPS